MRYRFRRSAGRVFATAACFLAAAVAHAADGPRQRLLMDTGWTFALSDVPNGQAGDVNDRGEGWRAVELPHDWSIEGGFDQNAPTGGPGGYVRAGVGWYRKHFATPADWAGRRVSVQFDGVYMSADVWVNGKQVGHQPFGYNTFVCDLTPHLNPAGADNVVAVRVDNSTQPNSRWYSGSGIYRHVWMNVTGPVHVADFGTYVTTPKVSAEAAEVRVVATVVNEGAEARAVTVTHELVDQAGKVAGRADAAVTAYRRYVDGASPTNQVQERWTREREMAEALAWLGRSRECVELVAKLLRGPSGLTVPILRTDPLWDRVRDEAAFQALLADPANSAPL